MRGEKKEQWMHLCEMAANEQDSERLLELVKQINQLLDENEQRLKREDAEAAQRIQETHKTGK